MPFPDALFRSLVQFAPDAFLVTNREGTVVFANAQAERLFGWERDELVDAPIERLVPDSLHERHTRLRAGYYDDPHPRPMGSGLNLTARRRDGSHVPVEISLSPIYTDSDRFVVATVRDVSERRRIEEALRASEERYRVLAENAEDVVYRIGLTEWPPRLEYVSPSVERLTGHPPARFMDDPALLFTVTHPDDRSLLERWLRAPDDLQEALLLRAVRPDGSVVWHDQRYTTIRDDGGAIIAVEGIARDVTEERELEDERRLLLAEAEIERERERIAADLHDGVMQTMYSVGLQLSSIVRRVSDLPEETRTGLQEAIGALDQAIRDIRHHVMDLRPVDFTGDLRESLTSLTRLFEGTSGITVQTELGAGLPEVDEGLAVEMFLFVREALSNVRRHAEASEVTVSLGLADDHVRLAVRDDGVGFDPEQMRRDSQFGLRNMATRARLMRGTFELTSAPGEGTSVGVRIPLAHLAGLTTGA